jgi:hypothetical protein
MAEFIHAPWTDEQIEGLRAWQESGMFHDYTCGRDGLTLVPTREGWICLAPDCGYTQDWAHAFSAEPIRDGWPFEKERS